MKCHCELCGRPAVSYRCVDPCLGADYTRKDCRLPRAKEIKLEQPAKEHVSQVRVGEMASAETDRPVRSPPVLVLIRAPAADDAASGEWKLRGQHQTRFRVRRMGDRS